MVASLVLSLWALVTDSLSIFLAKIVCGGRQSTSQKLRRSPRTDTLVPDTSRKCAKERSTNAFNFWPFRICWQFKFIINNVRINVYQLLSFKHVIHTITTLKQLLCMQNVK